MKVTHSQETVQTLAYSMLNINESSSTPAAIERLLNTLTRKTLLALAKMMQIHCKTTTKRNEISQMISAKYSTLYWNFEFSTLTPKQQNGVRGMIYILNMPSPMY